MSAPDFIVLSLPRSRSAWLASFLSYPPYVCGHDLATECASVPEFLSRFDAVRRGTVETGAVIAWQRIRQLLPQTKLIVVRRPVKDVLASFARIGMVSPLLEIEMQERAAMLDDAAEEAFRTIEYADLDRWWVAQWLFEQCVGVPFDDDWWRERVATNVQIDVRARCGRLIVNEARIAALKQEVAGPEITIEVESFASIWPEADALARRHFNEVDGGVEPNRPYEVDTALMQLLERSGSLKIITARVDSKLAGYCTWNIQPDPESRGLVVAHQGAWFVDAQYDSLHLGVRMLRKAIAELKKAGVMCIFPHHRLQGRGTRLGMLFKRMGAKEIQHTYSLWIGG